MSIVVEHPWDVVEVGGLEAELRKGRVGDGSRQVDGGLFTFVGGVRAADGVLHVTPGG